MQERDQYSLTSYSILVRGPFTNYVYKRKGVGGPKIVNVHKVENVNRGGEVGKKSQNFVNVVCERP